MAALSGVAGGVVSMLLALAIGNRDPSEELTRSRFSAAERQWAEAGPADYEIAIEVVGRQPATYRVSVRSGEVVSAAIDGRPLKQRRTFHTWSVPGMFATIERDLENNERFALGKDPSALRLTLRADFHPDYGFPQRYRRIEWGGGDMLWQVREFRAVE